MPSPRPLVSVVTPVYNGERYLARCIESIIEQTYDNWEYVIVNNCSGDRTQAIAERYAANDSRIRVHNNEEFLDLTQNWNHALRQISPHSKYCKIVHADDSLFPECLQCMVDLAEAYPNVGVVGSYILKGNKVKCDGLPYPSPVTAGPEICRAHLRGDFYLFGSPTSTLVRADLVRRRHDFYNEKNYHADVEVMFETLKDTDFGFVHQVLSYTRMHEGSQTSTYAERFLTTNLNRIGMLKKYGPVYLSQDDYTRLYRKKFKRYYRDLALKLFRGAPSGFIRYHRQGLENMGEHLDLLRLSGVGASMAASAFLGPFVTVPKKLLRPIVRFSTRRGSA